jgi:hypothetical protein
MNPEGRQKTTKTFLSFEDGTSSRLMVNGGKLKKESERLKKFERETVGEG